MCFIVYFLYEFYNNNNNNNKVKTLYPECLPVSIVQGTKYSIWRLSDLVNCDKTVSLFLFSNVHRDLWKTVVGSVVGILNASMMQNAEKVNCPVTNVIGCLMCVLLCLEVTMSYVRHPCYN